MLIRTLIISALILGLAGCATTKKEQVSAQQQESLQARVNDLEAQLKHRDMEIQSLQAKLTRLQKEKYSVKQAPLDVSKATPNQIQTALRSAGFYSGPIDGKIGKLTTEAIKEFQKANGLTSDGVVGTKTWAKLREFLN